MQVDRQPSPWPCVLMLAVLLLICLAAPSYWQDDVGESAALTERTAAVVSANSSSQQNHYTNIWPFSTDDWYSRFGDRRNATIESASQDNWLLSLLPATSIEELVAASLGTKSVDDDPFAWPVIKAPEAQQESEQPLPAAEPAVPGPIATAVLELLGEATAKYSEANVAPRIAAAAAGIYRQWISASDSRSHIASSLRLLGPNNAAANGLPIAPEPHELDLSIAFKSWCVPQTLYDQLEQLTQHPETAHWALDTLAQLHALTERRRLEGEDVQTILAALSDSTRQAVQMAENSDEDRLRVALLRAHWALARRLDRWAVVHDIRVAEVSRQRLASRDSLGKYFNGVPIEIADRTDTLALSTDLERYEQTRDPRLAREVIREQRSLAASSDSLDRSLADAVEQHYRNANVRIAITADMLNRFAGQERSEVRPLHDRIAGTPVHGRSHTQSQSRVRLEPATGSWQMELEAQGLVNSDTLANGGPARLRSRSATDFAARKRVVVDSEGVVLQPAWIDVSSHNRLVGVTTDYDWVPLFGAFARDRAMQQYRARQTMARLEVESRVSAQAIEEIDEAVVDAVDRLERKVRERFTGRLAEGGVKVTPVEMTTTHERVVARLRVASDEQLGSHTPRPRALSDSLASIQVHETALSNAAATLELDGKLYTASELQSVLRQKFPQMTFDSAEANRDAVFQFAAEDAVQFHINDGRLELTLALKSLELEGRKMRNFLVHAFYTPTVNGLEAQLVRDGSLGIEGRLSSSQRARLHNVFNSVLTTERKLPIVRLDDPNDARLAGLMITQLVLEDGWLGLAVGPSTNERVAERERSLR